MGKTELPVRTEFGFERTVCACKECQTPCQFMPGFLIPADLERIRAYIAEKAGGKPATIEKFAEDWLLASPGALVAASGWKKRVFRIPTLVPRRRSNGHCIFFDCGGCMIHKVAPFGCAFADWHMSREEGDKRSHAALTEIYKDILDDGPYSRLWKHLADLDLTDSRYAQYISLYGAESWELDALDPTVLADLVRDAVGKVRDDVQWATDLEEEEEHKRKLSILSDKWSQITKFKHFRKDGEATKD